MDDAISRQAVLNLLHALPPEEATTKALLIQSVKQMDAAQPSGPDNLVKDSQGLAKDLVNDTISRSGVSAWLANMGYSKLADVLMDKNRFPSAQPETHDKRTEKHACDLISRQMLLEYIHGEPVGKLLCDKYNLDGLIEQFPSAQPERKTGKWEIYVISMFDGEGCRCSECGLEGVPYWDFCPNCGANMREVSE